MTVFPWQQTQWQHLHSNTTRLAHALLLTGRAGLGKRQFATCFVASLLCHAAVDNHQACGHCKSCQLFKAGNHPDFLSIKPEAPGKAIKVDTIRQLVNFSITTAHFKQTKAVIIESADHMTIAASNALLKTLEEPPPGVYILLVSEHSARLLPTIRSRCQTIKLTPPERHSSLHYLHDKNVAHAELLLSLAYGAPLTAELLSERHILKQRQQLFESWQTFMQETQGLLSVSEQWSKCELREILSYLQSWLMDIIRLCMTTEAVLVNTDLTRALQTIANGCHVSRLFACLDKLYDIAKVLAENITLNKSLAIENMLLISRSCVEPERI